MEVICQEQEEEEEQYSPASNLIRVCPEEEASYANSSYSVSQITESENKNTYMEPPLPSAELSIEHQMRLRDEQAHHNMDSLL